MISLNGACRMIIFGNDVRNTPELMLVQPALVVVRVTFIVGKNLTHQRPYVHFPS